MKTVERTLVKYMAAPALLAATSFVAATITEVMFAEEIGQLAWLLWILPALFALFFLWRLSWLIAEGIPNMMKEESGGGENENMEEKSDVTLR